MMSYFFILKIFQKAFTHICIAVDMGVFKNRNLSPLFHNISFKLFTGILIDLDRISHKNICVIIWNLCFFDDHSKMKWLVKGVYWLKLFFFI